MKTIVISSDRDKLGIEYLKRIVGEAAITAAVAKIPPGNRPYISNVARILKIEIPKDLQPSIRSERGNAGLAQVREHLAKLKSKKTIAANGRDPLGTLPSSTQHG